jgi:murein DD-endopeptidase MepM/ murein hydrolase activator NlpD
VQNRKRSFDRIRVGSLTLGPRFLGLALATAAAIAVGSSSRPVAAPVPTVSPATAPAVPPPPAPAAAPASAMDGSSLSAAIPLSQLPSPVTQASLALSQIEIVVRRNDTLDGIFRRMKLNLGDLATLRSEPEVRQSLDDLRPGDAIHLTHMNGEVQSLVRRLNETETLSVTRDATGFSTNIIERPLETRLAHAYGRIESSLFEAAEGAGISDQTALALAGIFGWDIDFVLDIRQGDEFVISYQQLWQDGHFLRDGPILAAQFVNNGHVYRAVRYQLPDGSFNYFTPDGRSMRKAFLRAPVEFSRVSSRFNPHRFHPILNRIRAHKGVDYAAPIGTPVHAAGDGRIVARGFQGGYGRVVVIEHGGGISTLYGHLSRFARGIGIGSHVTQGEVIAYVGMSGLATGPHLHYEYRVNGVYRNPQTVPLPDAAPISTALRADFLDQTAPELAELDLLKRVRVASIQ